MAARTRLVLVLALALAACTPPGGTTPPTGGRKSPAPTRASAAPPNPPNPGTGLVPKPGGGLISDQASSLVTLEGVVRAPAGIIANNGGAIIANNGGGLITDNGAGLITDNGAGVIANNGAGMAGRRYALRAVAAEQKPFGGVEVLIQDAAGQPVPDDKGGVVRAVTGPDGRFRVTTPLPARNLVAVVKLVEGQGALQAIVGRGGGVRRADVELVSTLTTGYILGKFVKGQADPLATLEKLPPAVEADTRNRAAAALAAGRAAAPAALTESQVTATVDALRAGDKAFDAQMENVRKLLLAAGQSDLGEGLPATKVLLASLNGVLPAADGGFYLPAWTDRRLWRVKPDGTLTRVAGKGGDITANADGQPARDVGLGEIMAAAVDAQGRLIFADTDSTCRLWRVELDGRLKLIADLGTSLVTTMACAPDGTTWAVVARDGIMTVGASEEALDAALEERDNGEDLLAVAPDGTIRTAWADVPLLESGLSGVSTGEPMYVGPAGELFFLGDDADTNVAALRIVPDARRAELMKAPSAGPAIALDATGAWYYKAADGAIRVQGADGQDRLLLAKPPAELDLTSLRAVPAPGGGVYLADFSLVYLVRDGVATLKAGLPAADAGVGGRETSIDPSALAIRPDGTLIVAEPSRKRLVTVAGDGTIAVLVPPTAGLASPQDVGLDAAGNLYVLDGLAVKRVAADGTATTLHTHANPAGYVVEMLVAPDGTIYLAVSENPGFTAEDDEEDLYRVAQADEDDEEGLDDEDEAEDEDGLALPPDTIAHTTWRIPPGKPAERLDAITVGDPRGEDAELTLGLDPAGKLHALEADGAMLKLLAWNDGWRQVGLPFKGPGTYDFVAGFTLDAAGRALFGIQDAGAVHRADPRTGAVTPIAGAGGRIFFGKGVDDSVGSPGDLQFDAAGDLLFIDSENRQIKRIPKAKLD